MFIGWTQHLKGEDKERFKQSVLGSKHVLDRLKTLIENEEDAIDQTERDPKAYDNPSWAYKQAYKNGMRHGLSTIKQFVDLDKQKKEDKIDR
jgi:hypothetical protein